MNYGYLTWVFASLQEQCQHICMDFLFPVLIPWGLCVYSEWVVGLEESR